MQQLEGQTRFCEAQAGMLGSPGAGTRPPPNLLFMGRGKEKMEERRKEGNKEGGGCCLVLNSPPASLTWSSHD